MKKLVSVVVIAVLATIASSQDGSRWYELLGQPIKISFRIDYYPTMGNEEFRALEQRVNGFVDHPLRLSYEREKARRENGFQTTWYTVWCSRDGVVRYNRVADKDAGFADIARNKDEVWSLTQAYLTIVPYGDDGNDKSPDLGSQLDDIQEKMSWFFTGGKTIIQNIPVSDWQEVDLYSVASGEGVVMQRIEDTSTHNIVIELVECEPDPSQVGLKWIFRGHETLPAYPDGVSLVMEEYLPNGSPDTKWTIDSIEHVEPEELMNVSRRPEIDGADVVRGQVGFGGVKDFTGRVTSVTYRSADGSVVTIDEADTPRERSRSVIRVIGWTCAGALIVIVIVMSMKSKMR